MVVIAILGILTVIAVPVYSDYVTRIRRTDGHVNLLKIAQELERCYSQYSSYNDSRCIMITSGAVNQKSSKGYYSITASGESLSATKFILTAIPVGSQASDIKCKSITLDNFGLRTPNPDPNNCW